MVDRWKPFTYDECSAILQAIYLAYNNGYCIDQDKEMKDLVKELEQVLGE